MSDASALDAAYRHCEDLTSRQAKNFGYGIRLLRPPERRALATIYAVARRIDDISDGEGTTEGKLARLACVRQTLAAPAAGDPVLVALADAARRYPLPLDAFGELIDGCAMDVSGATYATRDDLVGYCRRVAGTIGRLSLAVFGSSDPDSATGLADDLGVAMQLTNILRDVAEDRAMGRVYLPAADVEAAGCPADLDTDDQSLARLVSVECGYAAEWFDRGLRLLPLLDHRSRACVSAMAGIYHRLLLRIAADPLAVAHRRVSLPTWEKSWVAACSLAGLTRGARRPSPVPSGRPGWPLRSGRHGAAPTRDGAGRPRHGAVR